MTDRGGAGGPEIAAAAVPPAGCREQKAETGGRWLGAGATRPRPRRMLSPCPVRPRAHDGDTRAQSVSSRGESCAALRRGHPRPCAPSAPAPPSSMRPLFPARRRSGASLPWSLSLVRPAAASPGIRSGPAALRPGRGTLRGARQRGRRSWPPPPRSLGPPGAFSFAFDNFLPAETFKLLSQGSRSFFPPGGSWFLHFFWGGAGGVGKKAQPRASQREGVPRLEGEGVSTGELSSSETSVLRRKKAA